MIPDEPNIYGIQVFIHKVQFLFEIFFKILYILSVVFNKNHTFQLKINLNNYILVKYLIILKKLIIIKNFR